MSEQENPAVSRIVNHELVLQRFGYWPSFPDAEVLKVTFEAHPGYRATVTFLIETHEFVNELDIRGYYKQLNNCQIELNFTGIQEMNFEDFSHQNVISDLEFTETGEFIECTFGASIGLFASIKAEEVFVLSLVPIEPTPEVPLIDIESADMSLPTNIVTASQDFIRNFEWSEWIYIGLSTAEAQDYQPDKVDKLTRDFFNGEDVYLIDVENSRQITLDNLLPQISILMQNKEVLISNKAFTKAMRFNSIGIMSCGQKRD